ncbi:MAG: hypothetical protein P4L65_00500 [Legionella sp.]|nr:hypothetical protein [Legionella sp.]
MPKGLDIFTNISKNSHTAKAKNAISSWQTNHQAKLNRMKPEEAKKEIKSQTRNPAVNGIGPYKLHLTLHKNSYTPEVIEGLISIICKPPNPVESFKYVEFDALERNKKRMGEIESLMRTVMQRADLFGNRLLPPRMESLTDEKIKTLRRVNALLPNSSPWPPYKTPTQKDIHDLLTQFTVLNDECDKSYKRFMNADQFTLYIPAQSKDDDILALSQEIDSFLTRSGAQPGTAAPTELKVGAFINFRQEILQKDFKHIHTHPADYTSMRISAGSTSAPLIDKIQTEMQQSTLYQKLSVTISPKFALIDRLEKYLETRITEARADWDHKGTEQQHLSNHYKSKLFGIKGGYSAEEKINAVSHLLKVLKNESNEPLTHKEMKILDNSKTKKILSSFKEIYATVPNEKDSSSRATPP